MTTTTTTAKKPTATDKRIAAINAFNTANVATGLDTTGTLRTVLTTWDTTILAAQIRELVALGRTERWTSTIERWATMVEDAAGATIVWAVLQGGIYAGHAA